MNSGPLPDFRNPPVIETVLGLQFDRISELKNGHLGAFWTRLGWADWPIVSDAPSLEPQNEVFGQASLFAGVQQVKLTQDPSIRLQIRNSARTRMIQVQNGRFHYNWLGQGRTEDYPKYERVILEFEKYLEEFRTFLKELSLGELEPNQWEVTYVNHIPRGTVWTSPADWASVFTSVGGKPGCLLELDLETINSSWRYEIPPRQGRLHVNLQHGKREGNEILILKLTARGPIPQERSSRAGLDLGRKTIVRAFKELTAPKAHKFWELIDVR